MHPSKFCNTACGGSVYSRFSSRNRKLTHVEAPTSEISAPSHFHTLHSGKPGEKKEKKKKNLCDLTLSAFRSKTPGMSICATASWGFAPTLFFCQEKNVFPPVLTARKRTTPGACQSGEEGQNPKTKLTGSLRRLALEPLPVQICSN